MRVDTVKLKKGSSELTPECRELIEQLTKCRTRTEMLKFLETVHVWIYGKCELYHWIEILDRFDKILEEASRLSQANEFVLHCDTIFSVDDVRLLLLVLNFTTLLIEHSFSRHLYNSIEHLTQLLSSQNMDVVLAVLNLLYMFSKRSNFIPRLPFEKKELLIIKLFNVAERWGDPNYGLSLKDCCIGNPKLEFLYQLCIDYIDETGHAAQLEIPDMMIICRDTQSSDVIKSISDQISKPSEAIKMRIAHRVRLISGFNNYKLRLQFVQARLQAVSILIYSNALQDNTDKVLYPGFGEELCELIDKEEVHLVEIRAAVLRTLTSMLHFDRNPNVPRAGSRLVKIIHYTGAERQGGILPLLVRDCIDNLTANGLTERYPLILATSLFSLLYHLASYEHGGHALVKSGMMQSLLRVISWPGVDLEHITFVTRAVRVIDLITNIDIAKFHQNNGLNVFIDRLEKEVNNCSKALAEIGYNLKETNLNLRDVDNMTDKNDVISDGDGDDDEQLSDRQLSPDSNNERTGEETTPPARTARSATDLYYMYLDGERSLHPNSMNAALGYSGTGSDGSNAGGSGSNAGADVRYPPNSYYARPFSERKAEMALATNNLQPKKPSCVTQRAALLKSMLNFLKKSIQDHAHFSNMRNIMETSLTQSLRHIIANAEYYGPSLFLLATDVVTVYVFNEPSLLSSLQDLGITSVMLKALLEKDVPATREVLGSIPNVFSALCLNERGLMEFMSYDPFNKMLKVLLSPDYLVAMRRRRSSDPLGDTATNLGNAMDDLMKHHPYLRVDATEAIVRLLNELVRLGSDPSFICWRANKDTSGPPLLHNTTGSNQLVNRALTAQTINNTSVIVGDAVSGNDNDESSGDDEDDDDEMSSASQQQQQQRQNQNSSGSQQEQLQSSTAANDSQPEREAIPLIDYILNVMKFIEAIFSNSSNDEHCREFVQHGGLTPILQLLSLPNLPVDSPVSTTAQAVANVCKSVLNLAQEIKVIKKALSQLAEIVHKLKPLIKQFNYPGGSVLLSELITCPKLEDGFSNAEYTPILHNMSFVHGYVVMLVHLCRNASNEMRGILLKRWGANTETGIQLLQNLVQLYISLVWESTILLNLCSDEPSQHPDLLWDEVYASTAAASTSSTSMDTEAEKARKLERCNEFKTKLSTEYQFRYIKSLLAASSRLGRALAELLGTLVKLSVGTPQSRQRRNNDFITTISKVPTPEAREIARILSSILVNGFSHESILPKPAPKLKLTFLICSVGFTGPMLFDDKRSSFHLMISQFCAENGLKAFFDMFYWALSLDNKTPKYHFKPYLQPGEIMDDCDSDENPYPDGTGEFLDAWLQLLEKMVNPRAILESPYTIGRSSPVPLNPFEPVFYLVQIHQLAMQALCRIWKRTPIHSYGITMTETIMCILKHLIKSNAMITERFKWRLKEIHNTKLFIERLNQPSRRYSDEGLNPDHVKTLIDMGFRHLQICEALRNTPSLEDATDYLLNNQSLSGTVSAVPSRESLTAGDNGSNSSGGGGGGVSNDDANTTSTNTINTTSSNTINTTTTTTPSSSTIAAVAVHQLQQQQQQQPQTQTLSRLSHLPPRHSQLPPTARRVTSINDLMEVDIDMATAARAFASKEREAHTRFDIINYEELMVMTTNVFDNFCEDALARTITFMELLPETTITGAELIAVLYRRHTQTNKATFLENFVRNIAQWTDFALRVFISPLATRQTKLDEITWGETATKLYVRLKVATLLLDDMYADIRKPFCEAVNKLNALKSLVKLLEKMGHSLQERSANGAKPSVPNWLHKLIELIDAIDNVSVVSQRKTNMRAVSTESWKWYDASTGKWNDYSESNNQLIKNAYNSGERWVALNIGRQRYTISFNCMTQVSEASGSHRPVFPTLKLSDAMVQLNTTSLAASSSQAVANVEYVLTRTLKARSENCNSGVENELLSLRTLVAFNETANPIRMMNNQACDTNNVTAITTMVIDPPGTETNPSTSTSSALATPPPPPPLPQHQGVMTRSRTKSKIAAARLAIPKPQPPRPLPPPKRVQKIVICEEPVGLAKYDCGSIIASLVGLLKTTNLISLETKLTILKLCARLTKDYNNARIFHKKGGIKILLKMQQSCGLMGFPTYAIVIIRHVLECPPILQEAMERVLTLRSSNVVPVGHRDFIYLLTQVSSAVARQPKIFLAAARSILKGEYIVTPSQYFDDTRLMVKSKLNGTTITQHHQKPAVSSILSMYPKDEHSMIQTSIEVIKELMYAVIQPCCHYGGLPTNEQEYEPYVSAEVVPGQKPVSTAATDERSSPLSTASSPSQQQQTTSSTTTTSTNNNPMTNSSSSNNNGGTSTASTNNNNGNKKTNDKFEPCCCRWHLPSSGHSHLKPVLPRSTLLKMLADAVRSYQSIVPRVLVDHIYTPDDSTLVDYQQSFMAFILDNFLALVNRHQVPEVSTMAKVLISSLSDCYTIPYVQTKVVEEVHAAVSRALTQPDSVEKHTRLQVLMNLFPVMIESPMLFDKVHAHRNNMYRVLLRHGVMTYLTKIAQYKDLSNTNTLTTLSSILRPMEILLRLTIAPGSLASKRMMLGGGGGPHGAVINRRLYPRLTLARTNGERSQLLDHGSVGDGETVLRDIIRNVLSDRRHAFDFIFNGEGNMLVDQNDMALVGGSPSSSSSNALQREERRSGGGIGGGFDSNRLFNTTTRSATTSNDPPAINFDRLWDDFLQSEGIRNPNSGNGNGSTTPAIADHRTESSGNGNGGNTGGSDGASTSSDTAAVNAGNAALLGEASTSDSDSESNVSTENDERNEDEEEDANEDDIEEQSETDGDEEPRQFIEVYDHIFEPESSETASNDADVDIVDDDDDDDEDDDEEEEEEEEEEDSGPDIVMLGGPANVSASSEGGHNATSDISGIDVGDDDDDDDDDDDEGSDAGTILNRRIIIDYTASENAGEEVEMSTDGDNQSASINQIEVDPETNRSSPSSINSRSFSLRLNNVLSQPLGIDVSQNSLHAHPGASSSGGNGTRPAPEPWGPSELTFIGHDGTVTTFVPPSLPVHGLRLDGTHTTGGPSTNVTSVIDEHPQTAICSSGVRRRLVYLDQQYCVTLPSYNTPTEESQLELFSQDSLHWWLEEAKHLDLESPVDTCLLIAHAMIPDLMQEVKLANAQRKAEEAAIASSSSSNSTNNVTITTSSSNSSTITNTTSSDGTTPNRSSSSFLSGSNSHGHGAHTNIHTPLSHGRRSSIPILIQSGSMAPTASPSGSNTSGEGVSNAITTTNDNTNNRSSPDDDDDDVPDLQDEDDSSENLPRLRLRSEHQDDDVEEQQYNVCAEIDLTVDTDQEDIAEIVNVDDDDDDDEDDTATVIHGGIGSPNNTESSSSSSSLLRAAFPHAAINRLPSANMGHHHHHHQHHHHHHQHQSNNTSIQEHHDDDDEDDDGSRSPDDVQIVDDFEPVDHVANRTTTRIALNLLQAGERIANRSIANVAAATAAAVAAANAGNSNNSNTRRQTYLFSNNGGSGGSTSNATQTPPHRSMITGGPSAAILEEHYNRYCANVSRRTMGMLPIDRSGLPMDPSSFVTITPAAAVAAAAATASSQQYVNVPPTSPVLIGDNSIATTTSTATNSPPSIMMGGDSATTTNNMVSTMRINPPPPPPPPPPSSSQTQNDAGTSFSSTENTASSIAETAGIITADYIDTLDTLDVAAGDATDPTGGHTPSSSSSSTTTAETTVPNQTNSSSSVVEMSPEVRAALGDLEVPEGVDPSFLAALPSEMREEVIQEHLRMQRIRQRAQQNAIQIAHDSLVEVNPEFLAALPPNIQSEVLMQQRIEQQRQAAQSANPEDPVDTAAFFQNLPESLRQAILTDMEDSQIASLPPELAAEAQFLRRDWETRNGARMEAHPPSGNSLSRYQSSIQSLNDDSRWHTSSIWYDANGTPQNHGSGNSAHHHTAIVHQHHHTHNSSSAAKPLALLMMEDENILLDPDSLATLLLFLFIEDQKINNMRLHRVIRNLCHHEPTRNWIINALISIIEKTNENNDDNNTNAGLKPQWLKLRVDAAFGYKSNIFIINKSSDGKPFSISINPQAAQMIVRNCLDMLFVLAKHYPGSFVPYNREQNSRFTKTIGGGFNERMFGSPMMISLTGSGSDLYEPGGGSGGGALSGSGGSNNGGGAGGISSGSGSPSVHELRSRLHRHHSNHQSFAQACARLRQVEQRHVFSSSSTPSTKYDEVPTTSKAAAAAANRKSDEKPLGKKKSRNSTHQINYNTNAKDFWDVLLNIDQQTKLRVAHVQTFPMKSSPEWVWETEDIDFLSFIESPFGKLLSMLPYKVICRSPHLTDMLVKLLASLSHDLPIEDDNGDGLGDVLVPSSARQILNAPSSSGGGISSSSSSALGPVASASEILSNLQRNGPGNTARLPQLAAAFAARLASTSRANNAEDNHLRLPPILKSIKPNNNDNTTSGSTDDEEKTPTKDKPKRRIYSRNFLSVQMVTEVLTHQCGTSDGLDNISKLIVNLAQCSQSSNAIFMQYLTAAILGLSEEVRFAIQTLFSEIRAYNMDISNDNKPSTSTSAAAAAAAAAAASSSITTTTSNVTATGISVNDGIMQDRFTAENVIISAPKNAKPSCELQLPSMKKLLSNSSAQPFFLRTLKIFMKIREIFEVQDQNNARAGGDTAANTNPDEKLTLSQILVLDVLWFALSQCLGALEESKDEFAVLVLQPTVEAFFLIHASDNISPKKPGRYSSNNGNITINTSTSSNQLNNTSSSSSLSSGIASNSFANTITTTITFTGGNRNYDIQTSNDINPTPSEGGEIGGNSSSSANNERVVFNHNLNEDSNNSTSSNNFLISETGMASTTIIGTEPIPTLTTTITPTTPTTPTTPPPPPNEENDSSTLNNTATGQEKLSPTSSDGGAAEPITLTPRAVQLKLDRQKFLQFAEKHRTVLNQILRQSPTHLSDGPFAVLVDHTRILDFDVKRKYFQTELERLDEGIRREENTVSVRRVTVFEDSFRVLYRLGPEEWKNRFYIVFEDEEGQDAGGLLREWYVIISREIFNPMYALFCVSPGDRVTYMINPSSHANPNHLSYFKFVGRVIAKAIHDNKLLECYFTRSFYKHILGKQVKYTDMESQDYEFYKGLDYLMKNDISTLGYELTFSTEVQEFGVTQIRDLIPNGRDIAVNEENKFDYVQLVCQLKMSGSIRQQLDAFLEGFYDIIPKHLISIFNEQELELLISGLPDIDIEDLKANTEYHKYTSKSMQIQWFWRALRSFDQADRAKFLQFVTGTSKVPLQGFGSLEGMTGIQKFQIHRDLRSTDRLPCAHTCFNQLDLPMYKSYDKLRNCLLKAIHECSEGFGFA